MNFDAFTQKIAEKNIILPDLTPPLARYVPFKHHGDTLYISGQLPIKEGALAYKGRVGKDVDIKNAQDAARLCGLNILAHINRFYKENKGAKITCLKLTGFIAADGDFEDVHKVLNGASDLMQEIFDDEGIHARAAVGVYTLPLGAAVEVEGIFSVAF